MSDDDFAAWSRTRSRRRSTASAADGIARVRDLGVTFHYVVGRPTRRRRSSCCATPSSERHLRSAREPDDTARSATASTTCRRSRSCSRSIAGSSARAGLAEEPPGTFRRLVDREAVRSRPRERPRARRPAPRRLPRAPDLPHRPLPRQGDGPEHPGAAVRERDLRAAVEPSLRRPRARSRWPSRSASSTAARSTSRPGRCATSCRTTCCRCSSLTAMEPPASFDGRRGARREGQAAAVRSVRSQPDRPRRASSCAASTRRASSTASRSPATATKRASRPTARPRPTSRCGSRSTTGGGRACRSSSGPGSASPSASPRWRSHYKQVPFLPLPAERGRLDRAEHDSSCASSPTRASRCRSRRRCPARRSGCAPSRSTSRTETFAEKSPEAYERVLLRRPGRATRRCSSASDEVEECWRIVQPLVDAFEARRVAARTYPAGSWGPPEADALLAHAATTTGGSRDHPPVRFVRSTDVPRRSRTSWPQTAPGRSRSRAVAPPRTSYERLATAADVDWRRRRRVPRRRALGAGRRSRLERGDGPYRVPRRGRAGRHPLDGRAGPTIEDGGRGLRRRSSRDVAPDRPRPPRPRARRPHRVALPRFAGSRRVANGSSSPPATTTIRTSVSRSPIPRSPGRRSWSSRSPAPTSVKRWRGCVTATTCPRRACRPRSWSGSWTGPLPAPVSLRSMLSRREADELVRRSPGDLMPEAARLRDVAHGDRITFSPKVFIPLTMLCRDRCGYCTFAKPPARLDSAYLPLDDVLAIARRGAAMGATRRCSRSARLRRSATPPPREWLTATTATARRSTTSWPPPRPCSRRRACSPTPTPGR